MTTPAPDSTRQPQHVDLPEARLNPYLGLALATIAVSFSAILIKRGSAQPLVIATYRLGITTLILLPLLRGPRLAQVRARSRRALALLALSGLLLALHFAFWTASLRYTSVASSVLFVTVHPALVAAVGLPLFGERLSRAAIVGIAATLLGSAIIVGGDLSLGARALEGDAMAFLGAVVFAGYLLIGRGVRQDMDNIAYSVPVYAVCTAVLAVLALAFRQPLQSVDGNDLLIFVALALLPTLGGHLLYNWTLRYLPAAVVSVSFLGEPVGASLLAWLLLGQALPPSTILGGAVVLAGIWLTARW